MIRGMFYFFKCKVDLASSMQLWAKLSAFLHQNHISRKLFHTSITGLSISLSYNRLSEQVHTESNILDNFFILRKINLHIIDSEKQ